MWKYNIDFKYLFLFLFLNFKFYSSLISFQMSPVSANLTVSLHNEFVLDSLLSHLINMVKYLYCCPSLYPYQDWGPIVLIAMYSANTKVHHINYLWKMLLAFYEQLLAILNILQFSE